MIYRRRPGEHWHLNLGFIRFARNVYGSYGPVRPTSGAAVGVLSSFWIYTRRRAWGWGEQCDWAALQYLDVTIAGLLLRSEDGKVELRPVVRFASGAVIQIRVTNHNPCDATGRVDLYGMIEREDEVRGRMGTIGADFSIPRGQSHDLYISVPENHAIVVERVKVLTKPTGGDTRRRIYGRPEFLEFHPEWLVPKPPNVREWWWCECAKPY